MGISWLALLPLASYCHFAVIYRTSPVGLPMPAVMVKAKLTDGEKLNRLLQELAWDAVRDHSLSGVSGKVGVGKCAHNHWNTVFNGRS